MRRAKLGLPSNYSITCVDERSQAIDKTVSRALMIVSSCVSICSIWTYPAFACQSSALWTLFRLALDPYSFLRHYNNRGSCDKLRRNSCTRSVMQAPRPLIIFPYSLPFAFSYANSCSKVLLRSVLRKSHNCYFINT